MPPFVPNKEQPLNVFFDLTLGGGTSNIYKSIPGQPLNIPIDFTLDHTSVGSGKFSFTLADTTGLYVEPSFWAGNGQISFQFGYQGKTQLMSDKWTVMTGHYVPGLKPNSFEFTFSGESSLVMPMQMHTTQTTGTWDEILKDFQDAYPNMNIQVTPDVKKMIDIGPLSKDSTEAQEKQWTKWLSETDWAFLVRRVKNLVSVDGKSGYQIMYNPGKDGAQPSLLIYLPGTPTPGAESGLSYSYPSREGNVISFDPKLDFQVIVAGGPCQYLGHQTITGDLFTNNITDVNIKSMSPTMGKDSTPALGLGNAPANTNQGVQITGSTGNLIGTTLDPSTGVLTFSDPSTKPDAACQGSIRTRSAPTSTGGKVYDGFRAKYWDTIHGYLAASEVSMTVVGDPRRKPSEMVYVSVYYPKNYDPLSDGNRLYYLTGNYLVKAVHHHIGVGSPYETVLDLQYMDKLTPPTTAG